MPHPGFKLKHYFYETAPITAASATVEGFNRERGVEGIKKGMRPRPHPLRIWLTSIRLEDELHAEPAGDTRVEQVVHPEARIDREVLCRIERLRIEVLASLAAYSVSERSFFQS